MKAWSIPLEPCFAAPFEGRKTCLYRVLQSVIFPCCLTHPISPAIRENLASSDPTNLLFPRSQSSLQKEIKEVPRQICFCFQCPWGCAETVSYSCCAWASDFHADNPDHAYITIQCAEILDGRSWALSCWNLSELACQNKSVNWKSFPCLVRCLQFFQCSVFPTLKTLRDLILKVGRLKSSPFRIPAPVFHSAHSDVFRFRFCIMFQSLFCPFRMKTIANKSHAHSLHDSVLFLLLFRSISNSSVACLLPCVQKKIPRSTLLYSACHAFARVRPVLCPLYIHSTRPTRLLPLPCTQLGLHVRHLIPRCTTAPHASTFMHRSIPFKSKHHCCGPLQLSLPFLLFKVKTLVDQVWKCPVFFYLTINYFLLKTSKRNYKLILSWPQFYKYSIS